MEKEQIKELANYCLGCKAKPCQNGCPLNNDTTGFIELIKQEKYKQAYELLCKTTLLSPICGRICPHTKQCQGKCIRNIKSTSVEIGTLEAFIGDMALENNWKIPKENNDLETKKVAIVGGGPAGLTCAAFLTKCGCNVTIYEKHQHLGGILEHGIPEFRLEKEKVEKTIQKILELGVKTETKKELGKNLNIQDLENQYDAIFLSIGANISSKMNIPGESLNGVLGANELLENKNYPNFKNKTVAVIGGGNVAMDAARTINKLGAKTKIIYRRSEEEMPAEAKEIEDAKKEGVEFLFQTNITKILGTEKVEKVECIKTKLIEKQGETRKVPVNIENSNYLLDIDFVIMALGSKTEEQIIENLKLETNKNGTIKVDETKKTSNKKIFAGGDLVGEKATVAWAARSGREAAENIKIFLKSIDKK